LTTTQPVEGVDFLSRETDIIEYSGRWDYGPKSIAKMGEPGIISRWIAAGHESMLEMVDATFFIECSRVVTHELVRHRIASYQQESQRFVNYTEEDPLDLFVIPSGTSAFMAGMSLASYSDDLKTYKLLIQNGVPKQEARYVLPNATRTRIIVKMNLREWRHVLRLRAHSSAQPEMQEVANAILETLETRYPEVFKDVREAVDAGKRGVR
jgi:thymidylate synthase (FAD)